MQKNDDIALSLALLARFLPFFMAHFLFLMPVSGKLLWKNRKMSKKPGNLQDFSTTPRFCHSTSKHRGMCGKISCLIGKNCVKPWRNQQLFHKC